MSALRDADARMFAASGELGQALTSAVQPYFKVARIRDYNSWWALARMDSLLLQDHVRRGEFNAELAARIANRMTGECKKSLKRLSEKSEGWLKKGCIPRLSVLLQKFAGTLRRQLLHNLQVKRDGSISYESRLNLWPCGHGATCACDEMCKAYFDALRDVTMNGLLF